MFDDLPLFSFGNTSGPDGDAGQLPEPSPPEPPHNGTDTSKAAAERIKPHVGGLRLRVLRALELAEDGFNCDELEVLIGMKHQTCSARLNDLNTKYNPPLAVFRVLDDGSTYKRPTRSGSPARVYYAAEP